MRKTASNRSFGLLLVAICVIAGALHYRAQGRVSASWGGLSAALLAISLLMPRMLLPAKRLWLRLGRLLEVVVSPVAVGLIHVVAITPVGALIRLFGKDLLALRRDPSATSYWVTRDQRGLPPASLKDQF